MINQSGLLTTIKSYLELYRGFMGGYRRLQETQRRKCSFFVTDRQTHTHLFIIYISSSSPPGLASKCLHFVTRDIAGRDMRRELKLEWSLRLQPRRFQNVTHKSQRVSSELLYRHQIRSSTCFAKLAKPVKCTIVRLPLG